MGMKRSISPVIAIVVLMLMTVSAAGMAYLTITMYQDEAQSSSEGAVEQLSRVGQSQIKVESISDGKLYLRSIGENCESLIVQVGNEPAQVLGDCQSTMEVFNISSECDGGTQTVKITSGGQTITKKVDCFELSSQVSADNEGPVMNDFYLFAGSSNCRCSYMQGEQFMFNATVDDSLTGGSTIQSCEFKNGTDTNWYQVHPADGAFDSTIEIVNGTATAVTPDAEYNITIRCTDSEGNQNSTTVLDPTCTLSYTYKTNSFLIC